MDLDVNVLVLNPGSSSLKYRLVDMPTGQAVVSGELERLEDDDFEAGFARIADEIPDDARIAAIGHRVVHGPAGASGPVPVTQQVIDEIAALVPLAPLHNRVSLLALDVAQERFPDIPHYVVSDTTFHRTLPEVASTYAIDADLAERHGVRRHGFHGISVQYVVREAAAHLGRDVEALNQIVLHLGSGASATAVAGGCSVDTSMGLTPTEGLVMGTRPGDLDPGVLPYLQREAGLSAVQIDELLNRRSGLAGLCGDSDIRDVEQRAAAGDERARLALEVYAYRVKGYIGRYLAQLSGVDAIVFTAGVGENRPEVRRACLSGLEVVGIQLDDERNRREADGPRVISKPDSPVVVLVVPTDEVLEIARQVAAEIG